MTIKRLLLLICAVTGTIMCRAQVTELPLGKSRAVNSTDYYVSPSNYDYKPIAKQITRGTPSNYEKAKLIFLWICENIKYDTKTDIRTADECWRSRKAVCQGYCELFYRIGEAVGLKSRLVYGQSRNSHGGMEQHAWISATTEKGDILLDPTWGAGGVVNGEFHRLRTPMIWFNVEPAWLIFTHFPRNKRFQNIEPKVTEEKWNTLCYASPMLERLGLEADECLLGALNEGCKYPIVASNFAPLMERIKIVEAPTSLLLKKGEAYKFVIESVPEYTLTVKNGEDEYKAVPDTENPNLVTISVTPNKKDKLQLILSTKRGYITLNSPIIEYEVVK